MSTDKWFVQPCLEFGRSFFEAHFGGRYYSDLEVQRQGPVTLQALVDAYGQSLDADSLIWKKGMKDWTALRDVPEVAPFATLLHNQ
jgi:hypothetical protein